MISDQRKRKNKYHYIMHFCPMAIAANMELHGYGNNNNCCCCYFRCFANENKIKMELYVACHAIISSKLFIFHTLGARTHRIINMHEISIIRRWNNRCDRSNTLLNFYILRLQRYET